MRGPISAITFSVRAGRVFAFTVSWTRSPSRAGICVLSSTTGSPSRGTASVALATPRFDDDVCAISALAPARRALTVLRQRKQVPKPVNATSPGCRAAKSAASQPSPTARSGASAWPAAE